MRIFLLSPASLNGIRAKQLMSPRASFDAAVRFRSDDGVPIADAFAFMSALYFRGKIAYARHFGSSEAPGNGVFVIAPGFGLVEADWRITGERMKKMRRTEVDLAARNYTRPMREAATALAGSIGNDAEVVLLGSVATGKYVDLLLPVFGSRLKFPRVFAGLGDMSRGGLMLRAVREGVELDYVTLDAPRHRVNAPAQTLPAQ
jgi:hypothetical protein